MTTTAASVAAELAQHKAELARHKEDDRADFNALRSEMGAMEKRLSARIDAIGDSIRPQVNGLLEDKMRADERAKTLAEVAVRDEARRRPNPWLLGAWQACAALLFGAILAWLARDHSQGGVGATPQYTTSVITTAPAPGRHP